MGYLMREIEKEGIATEIVQLSAKPIRGCIACYKCFENRDGRCAVKKDAANEYIEKIVEAQGRRPSGAPSFFQDVPAEMKALVDRAGLRGTRQRQDCTGTRSGPPSPASAARAPCTPSRR